MLGAVEGYLLGGGRGGVLESGNPAGVHTCWGLRVCWGVGLAEGSGECPPLGCGLVLGLRLG